MRVGIIGLGSIGTRHASNLRALGHYVIAYDVARTVEWAWARSIDEFLEQQPEAVMICAPASTHASLARGLLASGYCGPLFVEKPLATSVEDAEVFSRWPHPTTMVGYNLRFQPMAIAMREMFKPAVCGSFHLDSDMQNWPGQSYGPMILECSHEIDLALWCGAPATVRFARINAQSAYFMLGELGDWIVSLSADAPYSRIWSVGGKLRGYEFCFHSPISLGIEMYVREIEHFLDCAHRGVATITPFADGLRVLDVIDQAQGLAA